MRNQAKLENEFNNFAKALGPDWDRDNLPLLPLVFWNSVSVNGQLTELELSSPQFVAITSFYTHVEHYNKILESMMGMTIGPRNT